MAEEEYREGNRMQKKNHHHSHSHSHGPIHAHDHCHESAHGMFHLTHHEGSLIGSIQGRLFCKDFEKAQELLEEQIRILGQRIGQQGGIIGHIKLVINAPEHCCQISLTDLEENVRFFDMDSCCVEGAAIVFLLEEDVLHQLLCETLGTILQEGPF